ncbi:hypothetical protein BD311DRAFT_665050 [Dichomitus squalens]|uniref:F-box domain-containing protein n=1 Tax=Dichomitus squalens TaxID=114155 RepID=A0A4Q9MJG3_9APHY|nr:hypothetical protein BD311DRAFT_665050 [Dichomitus squalens]
MPARCHLFSLPAELLENVLIRCSADGHPLSVAALAQTCRQFRTLVYHAADRHLWRALFLTTFDDPRQLARMKSEINWQREFTERIWAARVIRRSARTLTVSTKKRALRSTSAMMYPIDGFLEETGNPDKHARVLNALLSVMRTACPSAPHQIRPISAESTAGQPAVPGLTRAHARTPVYPPPVPSQASSLNIAWLKDTLSRGLPFSITQIISYDTLAVEWHTMPEGQALCQLTAYLDFLPIPLVEPDIDDATPSTSYRQRKPHKSPVRRKGLKTAEMIDMSEEAQRARAREHARPHAFDMGYLSRRRHWGPYLAVRRQRGGPSEPVMSDVEADLDEDTDTDYDADYVPPDDASTSSATPEPAAAPAISALPSPEELRPDWTWLAAARIVAQCKLRQHVNAEDIAKLENWDNLREGAWIPEPQQPSLEADGTSEENPLQAEATQSKEPDEEWKRYERDWAGAEGVWRRLVCWLDYDDLLYHNSYGAFLDADLDEAWIIVPMSLRITGYSAPSLPHLYPDRPTIHVEGEMGGAGWVGSVDVGDNDIRRAYGTVSMLPDGEVRWSITSSAPGSNEDEWASEAVQLGGVGSAMGALGMWTGAFHEDGDPLGVLWQWRVE